MPKIITYEQLMAQYNVLVARTRDLEEQIREKNERWQEEEAGHKQTCKLVRQLCESILSRDHNEVVANDGSSWFHMPLDEIISRSMKSYQTYNVERTEVMNKLLDEVERWQTQTISLQDQISQLMVGSHTDLALAQEIVEKKAVQEEGIKKVPNQLRSAAENGGVELIIEDDTDPENVEEISLIDEMLGINEQAKLTAATIPIRGSQKKNEQRRKQKDNAMMAHMIDLAEYEQKMNTAMWKIVEIIGEKGISKYPEIEPLVLEADPEWKKSRLRMATKELYQMGIITMEAINLPLTPKVFVHHLTDIGSRLYKKRFGKNAVLSEVERVIAEHDNAEHGYGILDVEAILNETGRYQSVSSFNRSKAISLKNGKKYIPDLICVTNRYTEYIEYERGLHTQADFNVKCDKMTQVSRFLNFVVPNKQVLLKRLIPQIDAWIASRGAESLRNIKMRVTTALALKNSESGNDDGWLVIYDLKKGAAPVKTPE